MSDMDESQDVIRTDKDKKRDSRGRAFAFLVYADSAREDWIERLKALHVRGFISPCHDADTLANGELKKPHWHVVLMFDGKKSISQINEIREKAIGPDYSRHFEDIACLGAYVRYLTHMDDPDKAQYRAEDVISLGGADYDLASFMPGDDTVVMADISAYVVEHDITTINELIAVCRQEGRRDWLGYISRRGYVLGLIIGDNRKRLMRLQNGSFLPGDRLDCVSGNGDKCAVANDNN